MLRQGAGPDVKALSVFAQCQRSTSDEGSIESSIIPYVIFVNSACPCPALRVTLSYHPRLPHMSL